MGYCSRFDLEVEATSEDREALEKLLTDRFNETGENFYEPYFVYFPEEWGDRLKWYSYQEDMKEISSLFPDILFKLYRKGDEAGDLEKYYYKNGKMQLCPAVVTYEEYNPEKLK